MNTTLKVERRDKFSRGDLNQIRKEGMIPGVVYGKGMDAPAPISVNEKDLMVMLRTHPHAVVDLEVPGEGKHPVMMADLQRDTITRQVLHIDFHRINMNEKLKAPVRLEISGQSPGEQEGGMLQLVLHEIEVLCYPKDIPESVTVDVSGLQIGETLSIADLKLPSDVEAAQDPGMVVVSILAPQKGAADDEETADDAAEPVNEAETADKE
ncbi:50S ribosomal protein L25 [Cohnella kolymensis]|uniref:Large ribosomal subunit protein bL25 n=1 Tax=Cohnella kolymensis TaxID=1590652 RepID=A0ABR5A1L0_9BACL|nr:50S ribosomal protein L25 [Cohnella kolymensis]KIL34952.1 50S ribosomal protein L25 [Cohnella kolymensis]